MPGPAVQSLAVQTVVLFLFVKSLVGPKKLFSPGILQGFFVWGEAIFYGKRETHQLKREKSSERFERPSD